MDDLMQFFLYNATHFVIIKWIRVETSPLLGKTKLEAWRNFSSSIEVYKAVGNLKEKFIKGFQRILYHRHKHKILEYNVFPKFLETSFLNCLRNKSNREAKGVRIGFDIDIVDHTCIVNDLNTKGRCYYTCNFDWDFQDVTDMNYLALTTLTYCEC